MAFEIGLRVLCVDDTENASGEAPSGFSWTGTLDGLRRGVVYTVREYIICDVYTGKPCLLLQEINRSGGDPDGEESPYLASRFRPLSDARISVFRQMLVNVPKEVVG